MTGLDVIYIREVKNSLDGGILGLSVELLTHRFLFLLPAVVLFSFGSSVYTFGRKASA